MTDRFLILSDDDLAGLNIPVTQIITAIEQAIADQRAGRVLSAPKSALLRDDGRYMMTTLSTGDDPGLSVVKSVMVSPRNPGRGRPGVDGAIMVQHSETGQMLALMQAGWLTAMRTAGLSAVAAKHLARPQSSEIAFIGAGVQARSHLETFAALFPLSGITVYGRGQVNIDRLCAMARGLGLTARACDTAREAVADADLIVSSVTLSYDLAPFVDARWLRPGTFAAITDLALPWNKESMAAFDTIYVDDIEQERASPKKLVASDLVTGDLTDLLATPPAPADAARRAFAFRGTAIGDFALARLVWQKATSADLPTLTW
jgi:ornithine cyclodeaminase/alanine dehydrogenase-like protein (mu-crystallin family)